MPSRRGASRCGRRVRLIATVVALTLHACSTRAPSPAPQVPPLQIELMELDDALARFQEREAVVRTLRVRFRAAMGGPETRRAQGVLVVKKPDRLRLRMWSPFGLTVLDYLHSGDRATLQLPLEGKVLRDAAIDSATSFSPSAFVPAFLLTRHPPAENCRADAQWIACREPIGADVRELRIDRHDGSLRSETIERRGRPPLTLIYDDYRASNGVWLPYRITALAPGATSGDVPELGIDVDAYELNPSLDDDVFGAP